MPTEVNPEHQDSVEQSSARSRNPSLLRAGTIVSGMTLISRVLGFVRDQVMAIMFGAGATTDVFLVAWKIPNFLRKLFAEGAFAQAFIPVFADYREKRDAESLRALAAAVSGTMIVVLLVISTLGVMCAPLLIMLFAPGFNDSPEQFELATDMLRITFPYLFFVSLVAYAGSILNTFGKFAIPSLTPVLLNICMIVAAFWLAPQLSEPVTALAWGVLVAGALQLALQAPFLRQLGLLPRPRWGWRDSGVRRILKLMGPVIFGSSVAQINVLLDTIIASFLTLGSLSWLYYSDRLMQFPLGLLGVALATVILPRLSRGHAGANTEDFRDTLTWALRITLLIGLPAALALALLARPMLATLFEYGAFTPRDTTMAAYSLTAYAFGLPAFMTIKVLLPAFFARQDTRTPVRIGIIALLSNMVYNLALVIPMVMTGFIAPHTGLAIASTLSAWQQLLMLYLMLQKRGVYTAPPALKRALLRMLPALAVMAIIAWVLSQLDWSQLQAMQRGMRLAGIILLAGGGYLLALFLCGFRWRDLQAHSNPSAPSSRR